MVNKRSSVSTGAVMKNAKRCMPYPWMLPKLGALQVEKWLFHFYHPYAKKGRAKRVRQLSLRITDRCNLRCHTCGQWGDSGFLHDRDLKELSSSEVKPQRYAEVLKDLVKQKRFTPHSWFASFAPRNNPKIALVVFIENGGDAGVIAAPIAAKIYRKYFRE